MHTMFSLPGLLAFLLPIPALEREDLARRRSLHLLHLPRRLREDVGAADYENPADDPRWSRRIDLER